MAALYFRWDPIALSIGGVLLLVGLFALWFALFGNDADECVHMKRTLLAGLVVGGGSFLAGFAGPIILRPHSNQGPLLGIFITGPTGFVLGGVGGFVWSRTRGREAKRSPSRT